MAAQPAPVVAKREGKTPPPLTLARVNPLDHADDIKQLFLSHERPEFPAFFDRAYPEAVAEGACAWVGRDDGGRIGAYVAQFPRRFRFGAAAARGGLLGNLMVATAYRTFWPGVSLLRRAVTDLRESGSFDFLYADPNDQAQPVIRAAGLHPAGALRRFVLPLSDRRPGVGLGVRLYRLLRRWQARAEPLAVTQPPPGDEPGVADIVPVEDSHSLRPLRRSSVYRARLAGYPAPDDCWYTFHRNGAPLGRALARGPDDRGVVVLCVWECEPITLLRSLLIALGDELRAVGGVRLEANVMTTSRAEDEFRRAGFVPRAEQIPVLALPFTPLGAEVVAAAPEWRVLAVDLDR